MRDHGRTKRGFVWTEKAWYADALHEGRDREIIFGLYVKDGFGTSGEMCCKWIEIGGREAPRLQVFDDAWSALATFTDLIEVLARHDSQSITPEQFVSILEACGFEDMTTTELTE